MLPQLIRPALVPRLCAMVAMLVGGTDRGWSADAVYSAMEYRNHGNLIVIHSSDVLMPGNLVIDTGASTLVLDDRFALRLGPVQGSHHMHTSGGDTDLSWRVTPAVDLGAWKLRSGKVVFCSPMSLFSQASGMDIAGFIGMNHLVGKVLMVDYDRDRLVVADALPAPLDLSRWQKVTMNVASAASLESEIELNPPRIAISLAGQPVTASLDTGDTGSLLLDATTFDRLVQAGTITLHGKAFQVSVMGRASHAIGLIAGVSRGAFSYPPIEVDRSVAQPPGSAASLGIGFLARHNLLVDFPNHALYLQLRDEMKSVPDLPNASGVHVLKIEGRIVVHAVDDGSPGERSGIRAGDILLSIDGRQTDALRPSECRRLIAGSAARPTPLVIRRVQEERNLILNP